MSASPTEFLSVTDQARLIATAQNVPVSVVADDDGEERLVYGKTPASELALERLTRAFMPAILKAARSARVVDAEEAEAVALVEFVEAVRRHDAADGVPFSATIATVLRYAVKRADRGNDLIIVKNTVAATYWAIMWRHAGDFATAYAEVKIGTGLTPETFLAVHLIMSGIDPLDPLIATEGSDRGPRHALAASVGSHEEDIARDDEVSWLMSKVSDEEDQILRLAYGFYDHATETIRLDAGFRMGECLSDREISGTPAAHGAGRATVNRRRHTALATMRAALVEQAAQEAQA